MANFGELVLVLGEHHIPSRTSNIPEKFQKMLVPNKMQHILCTGNIGCKREYEKLRELAPNVHVVSGDYEYNSAWSTSAIHNSTNSKPAASTIASSIFPETKVIQVGEFRIGLINGYQIIPHNHMTLASMRRKLDVDILITGHTHKNEIVEHDGCWHINPGSITGAYSPSATSFDNSPSFVLLAVQGPKVVCYMYELINGEVEVSKTEFSKTESLLSKMPLF